MTLPSQEQHIPFMFHSPLSPDMLGKKENHTALLLQFILKELLETFNLIQNNQKSSLYSPYPRLLPFDFSHKQPPLNKLEEHVTLLIAVSESAGNLFASLLKQLIEQAHAPKDTVKDTVKDTLRKLFVALEPLVKKENDNENLLYYILKEQKTIDALFESAKTKELLLSLHPPGLILLRAFLTKQFEKRGFSEIGYEVHALLEPLIKT